MESFLSDARLRAFRRELTPLNTAAARAASKAPLEELCFDAARAGRLQHKFSLEIPTLPACDQKASGRCWIFAGLNLLREKIAKEHNLENLELSQNYLCFYDHLEKAHTFYRHILETADSPLEDRYVSMLMNLPVGDGGWWEYFAGLCRKYGVVPRDAMPETYQSEHTDDMNNLLNMQLRRDALTLRKAPEDRREALIDAMLGRVYRILAICLGTPPETFDFEYVDRDRTYHAARSLTPRSFYDRFIGRNLDNIVSLLNAPIPSVPFHTTCYTKGEESIYGVYPAKRLNLPLEEFKAAVLRQLQDGDPVWFVCDCDYFGSKKEGIWDTELFDYERFLGIEPPLGKGDLLETRQCSLNHAMLLTGVNLVDGVPDRWKIQNSWGQSDGNQGYFLMSDSWFDRYVFTASIDRNYLTEEENAQFDQEAQVLPPWHVLG